MFQFSAPLVERCWLHKIFVIAKIFGGHDERVWPPTVEQMINTVPRNPYNLFYARMITMLLK